MRCLLSAWLVLLFGAVAVDGRTWTDKTGKLQVEAEFVELVGDRVTLKRADGRQVHVPLLRLSEADQAVAQRLAKEAAGAAGDTPTSSAKRAAEKKPARDEPPPSAAAPINTAPSGGQHPKSGQQKSGGERSAPNERGAGEKSAHDGEKADINNLASIALALLTHHDALKRLPLAIFGKGDKPGLSWRVALLPFIDEEELYDEFHLDEPWDSQHNKKLISRMPKIYQSTGSPTQAGKTRFLTLRGSGTMLDPGKIKYGTRLRDVMDGTSYTLLVVEAAPDKAVIWTRPDDLSFDSKQPRAGLFGPGEKSFLAVFGDGRVRRIQSSIPDKTLSALATRDGREAIRPEDFEPNAAVVGDLPPQEEPRGDDGGGDLELPENRPQISASELAALQAEEAQIRADLDTLKDIGIALLGYEVAFRHFPPAVYGKGDKPGLSWRVAILPYIDRIDLYQQFHLDEPWDSEHNQKLIAQMPDRYLSHGGKDKPGTTRFVTLRGKGTIFTGAKGDEGTRLIDVKDGASQTLLVVQAAAEQAVIWTKPDDLNFDPQKLRAALYGKSSFFLAVCADSNARRFEANFPEDMLRGMATHSGGERVSFFDLGPQVLPDLPLEPPPLPRNNVPDEEPPGDKAQLDVMNNMKKIALALHLYQDNYKQFPPAVFGKRGKPGLSWRVAILPYLDERPLYDKFHLNEPWDSEHNKQLIAGMPAVFHSPHDKSQPSKTGSPAKTGSLAKTRILALRGKDTMFPDDRVGDRGVAFKEVIDGLRNTLMVVQADPDRAVVWTKPDDLPFDAEQPRGGLFGDKESLLAIFGDAKVRSLKATTSDEVLRALASRNGREGIQYDERLRAFSFWSESDEKSTPEPTVDMPEEAGFDDVPIEPTELEVDTLQLTSDQNAQQPFTLENGKYVMRMIVRIGDKDEKISNQVDLTKKDDGSVTLVDPKQSKFPIVGKLEKSTFTARLDDAGGTITFEGKHSGNNELNGSVTGTSKDGKTKMKGTFKATRAAP